MPFGANATITRLFTADVNKDGKLDVIALIDSPTVVGEFAIGLGKGDGTFIFGTPYSLSYGDILTVGDFNNDGTVDVMLLVSNGESAIFCPGNGTSAISCSNTPIAVQNSFQTIVAGDFDGDGNQDLLLAGETLAVWRGDGKGGLSQAFSRLSNSGTINGFYLATGDLAGDGRPSIFFSGNSGYYGVMLNLCK